MLLRRRSDKHWRRLVLLVALGVAGVSSAVGLMVWRGWWIGYQNQLQARVDLDCVGDECIRSDLAVQLLGASAAAVQVDVAMLALAANLGGAGLLAWTLVATARAAAGSVRAAKAAEKSAENDLAALNAMQETGRLQQKQLEAQARANLELKGMEFGLFPDGSLKVVLAIKNAGPGGCLEFGPSMKVNLISKPMEIVSLDSVMRLLPDVQGSSTSLAAGSEQRYALRVETRMDEHQLDDLEDEDSHIQFGIRIVWTDDLGREWMQIIGGSYGYVAGQQTTDLTVNACMIDEGGVAKAARDNIRRIFNPKALQQHGS